MPKENSIQLLPMLPNDAPFLTALMNDNTLLSRLHQTPTPLSLWQEAMEAWEEDPDEENYIILADNVPVGWLGINSLRAQDKNVYIKVIAILPAYQKQGIGQRTVHTITKILRNRNYASLSLYTDKDNLPAQHCYGKCGFRVTESVTQTMADGAVVERLKMKMQL